MPARARSICRKTGCHVLIATPGYCEDHAHLANPFRTLDARKTPESVRFYRSYKWTQASIRHRIKSPICKECERRGITKKGELVHHEPPLEKLIAEGLNPLDDKYLETLCHNCHQGHLRAKGL